MSGGRKRGAKPISRVSVVPGEIPGTGWHARPGGSSHPQDECRTSFILNACFLRVHKKMWSV